MFCNDIKIAHSHLLTNAIFKQKKYLRLEILKVDWNEKIESINHLKILNELHCS